MTKRQLIDQILSLNQTAEPGFLAQFQDRDLDEYLAHLAVVKMPRGASPSARPRRDFHDHVPSNKSARMPVSAPAGRREAIMAAIERAEHGMYTPA